MTTSPSKRWAMTVAQVLAICIGVGLALYAVSTIND